MEVSNLFDLDIGSVNPTLIFLLIHAFVQIIIVFRILLRPHRQPASRMAWMAVVIALPALGIILYLLFGETNIGKNRTIRVRKIHDSLPEFKYSKNSQKKIRTEIPVHYESLFDTANSISGFGTFFGNSAKLFSNSDMTIESLVKDIDAAQESVHILFYIWLTDNNGLKVLHAVERASKRGVSCRVMVDALGSRQLIKSKFWKNLSDSGVQTALALPLANPLLRMFAGRIDLRNHRKITVIDNSITYCGSQNCADAEFLIKAKYAPWVDAVMRFEGPIALQQQRLFIGDWLSSVNEDLTEMLNIPVTESEHGLPAQAFGTGPTVRNSAMPEMFTALMFSAQKTITITTPYFVPDESLQSAICAAALRGVVTKLILPAKNDSFVVAAASHSYYQELLSAGVIIYEYVGGLLHTKTVTVDGEITLIGSANMDRRSFDLNYENNILLYDSKITSDVQALQDGYIKKSNLVLLKEVETWSLRKKLWNNTIAILGPLL